MPETTVLHKLASRQHWPSDGPESFHNIGLSLGDLIGLDATGDVEWSWPGPDGPWLSLSQHDHARRWILSGQTAFCVWLSKAGRAKLNRGEDLPKGPMPSKWRTVKARAESIVKRLEGEWPGQNELAKRCQCSSATMRKAIEDSLYLQARRAEHETRTPCKSREISGGGILDTLIAEQRCDAAREDRQHIKYRHDGARAR